ncbi:mannose-6-phosphate isomerase, class I [Companilactobacillus allii]|uniref:Mannose-6-phosphate isomerase n=1 Tax=Companilactobacillus allii TaxID=1847728 RepID=A0A1P8PZM4_9LACO|nr:mannose-6-phosphate isomerase, class I [Companilactobacillus allii]APX71074.1 mannose-6-phosphate isomerase, class I [Companilactobacillus allii]USQ68151.1 mannose-6-phosphate isomerase, class I [Companilactobacillus allii]
MSEPLFLKPVFHNKIWGGRKLETKFGYKIPDGDIGECWAISGHPHGRSLVENGEFSGEFVDDLWNNHSELFGNPKGKVFPLLTKILDAEASLSVQVHPDNDYAWEHEHELGKTECWYIIDAEPGSYLIYGHNAKNKEELDTMIESGDWDHLLRKVPVKTGDFYFVPSGTVHALNKGIMALETQQSSDTTYRLYDYDRVEKSTGKKRELHIKQSEDTITVPHVDPKLDIVTKTEGKNTFTTFVQPPVSPYFAVYRWEIKEPVTLRHNIGKYTLISVISGEGKITVDGKDYDLNKGVHLIVPATVDSWTLDGDLNIIASESGEE